MPAVVIFGAAGLLFLGALPLPYGYYTLLRLVATLVFGWAAYVAFERQQKALPWLLVLGALIFNPLVKVHLKKEVWVVIDICSGIGLLAARPYIEEARS